MIEIFGNKLYVMRFFDYFLLALYRFVYSIRKSGAVELSARLYLSFYVWLVLDIFFWTMAMMCNRYEINIVLVSYLRLYSMPVCMFLAFFSAVIINIYYIKYRHLSDIEISYNSLSKDKQVWVRIFIWIFVILIPICAFICGRLFLHGQVKWW